MDCFWEDCWIGNNHFYLVFDCQHHIASLYEVSISNFISREENVYLSPYFKTLSDSDKY